MEVLQAPAALDSRGGGMMGGPGLLGGPLTGHMPVMSSYRILWEPEQPVRGQPTDLGVVRQDLHFLAPLWQTSQDEVSFSAHVRSEVLDSDAFFPISGRALPDDLWNIGFGGTYRHRFDNDWIAGGSLMIGSASDKPFHGWDEMNIGLNTFLRLPSGERNSWLFTLSYSPTAQLPFSVPGVAYSWVPSDQFRANIGLPFQLTYCPTQDLRFDFSYMLLTSIHARATYRCWGPVRAYVSYDWENEAYLPVDRPDVKDRLFSYDMRLSGGVQTSLDRHWLLDLSSGYVFDRFYALGRSSALDTQDRINVGDGPFIALSAMVRW
jgi:hypothetical protein